MEHNTAARMPIQPPTTFQGLATGLDNATQARIRIVDSVYGVQNVVLYINGLPASNGGKPLENIGDGRTTGWIYVTPGTYTVAFVPQGAPLTQALFTPVTVNAVARASFYRGHIGASEGEECQADCLR